MFRHIVLIYKLSSLLDFLINEPKFLNYLPVTYFVPFLFYYEFVKILQRMIYKKGEGNLRETYYYPMYIFLEFEFPSLTHYRMMGDPSFKKSEYGGSSKFPKDSLPPFYISFFTVYSQIYSKKKEYKVCNR